MVAKIIFSKITNRNETLRKLKKKWRFWRVFRFFFLRSKKKNFFPKISWLFNQRRIIWHQLSVIYGKKIKNLAYTNHKAKKIFNTKFCFVLCKLELRLNILILRMGFVNKLQEVNFYISKSQLIVNNVRKNKRYLVSIKDLITFTLTPLIFFFKRFKKIRWNFFNWKKWKRQFKNKKFRYIYFLLKKNYIFNFMEINYYYYFGILIRFPLLGEITYRNKKKLLTLRLLQKVYFLY